MYYEKEKLNYGQAIIKVMPTIDGRMDYSDVKKWDDYPEWITYKALKVQSIAKGDIDIRYLDWRRTKEIFLEAYIDNKQLFSSEKDPDSAIKKGEDYAIDLASKLEERGFDVKIDFCKDEKRDVYHLAKIESEKINVTRNMRDRAHIECLILNNK